jgi:hypothetical protein
MKEWGEGEEKGRKGQAMMHAWVDGLGPSNRRTRNEGHKLGSRTRVLDHGPAVGNST